VSLKIKNTPRNSQKTPPSKLSMVLESRAFLDIASIPFSLIKSKLSKNTLAPSLPVIMFPAFNSDERYLKALEYYLRNLGYSTEGWGLGKNSAGLDLEHSIEDLSPDWGLLATVNRPPNSYKGEGSVAFLCQKAIAKIKQRSQELDSPVIIIGWSLGGYIARECARELPDNVAQVITFGAPVVGGPKYTRAAKFFREKELDLDWIEASIAQRNSKPIKQPITSIYSKSDAVVSTYAALDTVSPNVKNIEVDSSHLGMGFNRNIWKIVSDALSVTRSTTFSDNEEAA